MLNKYTLEFLFKDQAQSYLTHSRSQILREVTSFTIYASLFSILNIAKFILLDAIPYILISLAALIIILAFWKLLQQKPNSLNITVTIYQIFLLAAFKLPELMQDSKNPTLDQSWYYGFQCGYLHFSVYLLSANFLYQTALLIIVIGLHLEQTHMGSSDGIINIFLFISMLFSMVAIKYNYEKAKKEQYFQSCQQKQWEQLLSKALSSSVLLISHDKKQDQLLLEKENKVSLNLFHLKDSGDMRQLFRHVFLGISQLLVTSNGEQGDSMSNLLNFNMEYIVRKFLTKTQEQTDSFKTYKYLVRHQENQKLYNVKILRCVFNNQLQCLMIVDSKRIQQCDQTQVLWSMLQNISEAALESSSLLMKIINKINQQQVKQKLPEKYLNYYFTHNLLQLLPFSLCDKIKNLKLETIHLASLKTALNPIIGNGTFALQMSGIFVHDFSIVQQLFVSCFQVLSHIYKQISIQDISILVSEDEINFQITMKDKPMKNRLMGILQNNWMKSSKGLFRKSSVHQSFLERMSFLMKQSQTPINLLVNICITQIILSQYGVYNHLEIVNDEIEPFIIKFSLLHQINQQ